MAECIDSIELDDWEIETDNGWRDITHIHKTIEYTEWLILTCSGHQLICADNHIVFDENYKAVFVKDLQQYYSKIITKDGPEEVIYIEKSKKKSHMYDLSIDSDTHRFWSAGILSHNSTVVSGYVSWYVLFNEFKTAIILANKEAIAKEIFSKVQYIIESLPPWLQQGILEWNKKSLSLENGSRCLCAATSPSAVRGMSCVTGDTKICITDEYDNVYYDTIDKFLAWGHKVKYYGHKDYINVHNILHLMPIGSKRVQLSSTCCKILTEKGFRGFTGIIKHDIEDLLLLTTNRSTLKCTGDHKVLLENGKYIRVDKLNIEDKLYNNHKVISIDHIEPDKVYDILDVEETNSYFTNGIVSHNCNLLVLDEFANLNSNLADEFIASVFPTLSSSENSKLVIISCVTKDTYVFSDKGIKQVSDFIDPNQIIHPNIGYTVVPYKVDGFSNINSGNIMVNSGIANTRIITSKSAQLECSTNHKLWACKNGIFNWYESKDLTIGDYISIKYGQNIWGNNDDISDYVPYITNKFQNQFITDSTLSIDLAYVLGLYIAEGWSDKNRTVITCGDDISNSLKILNLPIGGKDIRYIIGSMSFSMFLQYLGFNISTKAKYKIIPPRLLECSKEVLCSILSGMFDGDGCANKNGTISYASSSLELIKQVRMILLNIGITTQLYKSIIPPTKKVAVYSTIYSLEINSYKDCNLFYNIIKFRIARKQERQQLLKIPTRNVSKDIIPFGRDLLKENGIAHKEHAYFKRTPHISRKTCLTIDGIDKFTGIINQNLKWEKITSIEESENEVFDFSLEHIADDFWCHSVIYNGIVGHQTPFGLNHFHKLWVDAINGNNDFIPVSAHWSEHPKRDQEWADKQLKKLGEVRYRSEIECVFSGSSYTLVDGVKLAEIPVITPIFIKDNLEIFFKPEDNHSYVIIVDVSRGRHHDYSALSVIDISKMPYNIVAIYKDNDISVLEFPHLIYNLAKQYNDAYILIESNDLGESVSNTIWYEYEYDHIYFTSKTKLSMDRGFPGVRTTAHVKSLGCSVLKDLIEQDQLILNSHKIIEELGVFVKKAKSYAASDEIINDDLTTTLWLFGWLTAQDIFQEMISIKSKKLLSEKKEAYINEYMTPYGFYTNAAELLEIPNKNIKLPDKENPYHLTEDQMELLNF